MHMGISDFEVSPWAFHAAAIVSSKYKSRIRLASSG